MDILRNAFNIVAEVWSYAPATITISVLPLAIAALASGGVVGLGVAATVLLPLTALADIGINTDVGGGPDLRRDLREARTERQIAGCERRLAVLRAR